MCIRDRAKDGIQLIAKARVTVRANIRQLVGGAGEDTILARVGEGIVSSICLLYTSPGKECRFQENWRESRTPSGTEIWQDKIRRLESFLQRISGLDIPLTVSSVLSHSLSDLELST